MKQRLFYKSNLQFTTLIPNYLLKYFKVMKPKNLESLHVNDLQDNIFFYFQMDDGIKFPLYYYQPFKQTENSPLPQGQNWTTIYDTNYNLIKNELKQVPTVHILKSKCYPNKDNKYYASNKQNTILIRDELDDDGFSTIVDQLTFSNELKPGKITSIQVYYYGVNQSVSIPVEVSD